MKMKSTLLTVALLGSLMNLNAQSDKKHPEWMYKIRMVSMSHIPRKGKFDAEKVYEQALAFKSREQILSWTTVHYNSFPACPMIKRNGNDK